MSGALKPTTINATFFEHNERSEGDTGAQGKKARKLFGKKGAAKPGKVYRDLDDENARHDDATPASTQPSTRRSSVTAVHEQEASEKTGKASATKGAGDVDKFDKDKIVLVRFEEGDPENPLNWSRPRKWLITFLLCMMTVMIGLSTTAYSSGIGSMVEEFHVANVVGQIGMMCFNGACAVAPLFLAPFCEMVGRREVYLSAYLCFTLIFLLLALAPNIGAALAARFLSGLFGCVGTILVGGTLADIWNTRDRGLPMSCFTFSAIFGTVAAPIYCGFIDQSIGWRWVEWVHMIANGVLLILEVFLLKETRGAKILLNRAKKLRKETGRNNIRAPIELENETIKDLLRTSCTRSIVLLFKEPTVLAFGLWIAYAWGITFLFLSAIPLCFQNNHGWSEGIGGLPYIALVVGCFIGFATSRWADSIYDRKRDENNGIPIPEYRLIGAMWFAWMMPAGLFIFSFTQYGFITPVAPIISLLLILHGIYHIFNATYNFTADAYPEVASSAIAGQGLLRNMFGGATPLFANQMFNGMGYQYAGLLLSLVASLAIPLPYVLFKYGETIRAKSKYASTDEDLEKERVQGGEDNERRTLPREAQYTSSFV
ncbi:MFS transporter [Rhodotorula paludigena]|uniref:MFS transporter n=1 Tax=Rhodotorula paludigena TaxID=86838 RepID=UPI003173BEB1